MVVPPWPKSVVWYNSSGRVDTDTTGSRYRQITDSLGHYALNISPTEAMDQGEWKCAVTSTNGVVAITKTEVTMNSKYQNFLNCIVLTCFCRQFRKITESQDSWRV